jgi:hypothetical protein
VSSLTGLSFGVAKAPFKAPQKLRVRRKDTVFFKIEKENECFF